MSIEVVRVELDAPARAGCADAALRDALARHLGHAPAIARTELGKPYAVGGGREVSVSHSGRLALVALRAAGPVGVDLEQHRALDRRAIAERFFTRGEAARVAADPDVFFRIWVRKEAWAKAQGLGLRIPLDALDVSGDVPGWTIVDLAIAPGYAAAIAWPGDAEPIAVVDHPGAGDGRGR